VLQIDSHDVDAFNEDVRTLVLSFVPTIAAAVQNAQLFEQERETLHRLEEAQRLKDSFLAIVSHELRTPLAAAMGFAETLNTRVHQLDAGTGRGTGGTHPRGNTSAGSTDRRHAVRLGTGDALPRRDPTADRPAAVVAAAVSEDVDRKAPVDVVMPAEVPQVMADEPRLHQVLTNLLDNAVKFSPVGERITVRVEVVTTMSTCTWRTGAEVSRRRPVTPSSTCSCRPSQTDVRSVGGLGIGLHVVRRLCDGMNAPVSVEDRDGGGTRFTVRLQRAR
jgi:signal transduction histidine kinase